MSIKIFQLIEGAKQATGLAVIIDVFRAFTVEAYLVNNGVQKLIPVGNKQIAYDYKEKHKDCILIGERRGIMLEGFDYGNSPTQIEKIDFSGKTVVHTTSSGTQGIANTQNAKEILTGSLVNAKAIAEYIKSLLEGENPNLDKEIEELKNIAGKRFFDPKLQNIFPERDFYLSTELNKFNFVLKVEKDDIGLNYIKKINVEQ